MVIAYFGTKSYQEVKRAFRERFPRRDPPIKKNRWSNVNKKKRLGARTERAVDNDGGNDIILNDSLYLPFSYFINIY